MKDHLNLNVLSKPMAGPEGSHESFPIKPNTPKQPDAAADSRQTEQDDVVDARFSGTGLFDQSDIEGMDFNRAMEFTAFIREQASLPEGRRMMGMAHQSVTPRQAMELFANA